MEIEKEPKVGPDSEQDKEGKQEKEGSMMERVENIEVLPGKGASAKLQIETPIVYERYSEMKDGIRIVKRRIGERPPEGLPSPPVPENGVYRCGKYLLQVVESSQEGTEISLVRVMEMPEDI